MSSLAVPHGSQLTIAKHKHDAMQLAITFCVLSGPPDAPMLTELRADTTSLYLSWEEPTDNNGPILIYNITLQVMDSKKFLVFTSNITELTVTGLTPFTVYSVQVVAVNSIGSSAPSELTTVMTAEGSECVCLHIHTPVLFIKYGFVHATIACVYGPLVIVYHILHTCHMSVTHKWCWRVLIICMVLYRVMCTCVCFCAHNNVYVQVGMHR